MGALHQGPPHENQGLEGAGRGPAVLAMGSPWPGLASGGGDGSVCGGGREEVLLRVPLGHRVTSREIRPSESP